MFERFDSRASRLLVALLAVGGLAVGTAAAAAQDASVQLAQTDGQVVVRNATDATIAGTSSLSAGTNLTVRVQSAGDTQPQFLKTDAVSVAEDGSFEATLDFSEQSAGDAFSVTVVRDGETVAESEGVVRAADGSTATGGDDGGSGTSTPGFGVLVGVVAILAVGAAGARDRPE